MHPHAFVDESKSRKFLLAAAIVEPRDLDDVRRVARSLQLPGQRRVHFSGENNRRRKTILHELRDMPVGVVVYDASSQPRRDRRRAALERLVDDLAKMGAQRLVLERDDSIVGTDKKDIRARAEISGCIKSLSYEHMRAYEEPLLLIPDAVAWCCQKGGMWLDCARGLVTETAVL